VHGAGLRLLARLAAAVGLVLASAVPAVATTVVQMRDADLAAQAAAVLLGRVTALQSHLDTARGQIFTDVTLALEEVVEGPPLPATVTLRQPGGRVGALHSWVDGSPEFVIGERVLVYVRVAHDGTLRVLQLYQGKLSVFTDPRRRPRTPTEWTTCDAPSGRHAHTRDRRPRRRRCSRRRR
jgi:hypothetical protein